MYFSTPPALLLLLLIPVIAVLGWPSRGFNRKREIISLCLRLIIVLCLVFSLAGLAFSRFGNDLAVVFLLDASDSMTEASQSAALNTVRQSMAAMRPGDQAAVIVFGGDALVEQPMSSNRNIGPVISIPIKSQTDLSQAIRLGLALYPPEAARRMVILSDGQFTAGDTMAAARMASAAGVQILSVPFINRTGPEVLVSSLDAPNSLHQGENFDVGVTIQATQDTASDVRLLVNGELVYQTRQIFKRGLQSFSIPLKAGEPGFYRYQVQLSPDHDTYYQNNEMAAFSSVEGPPKVLLVAASGTDQSASGLGSDEAAQLHSALVASGLDVQDTQPSDLPSQVDGLAGYSSLVMVDIPAAELSQRQMTTIQLYVRDLGGGLIVVGGPESYGVGGYYRTRIEETLPVEMQIKDEARRPSLAIVYIIDHSGSMSETSGGAVKLELAKEAAIRSVDLLYPTDRVGVITFDESASWVVPLTDLSNPAAVKNAIGSIRAGGGTNIMAGVQAMAKKLPADPSKIKHVILLTDGGADPTGIPELLKKLHDENGITLSTVGIGNDAAPYLAQLAELGGGRYHFTGDPSAIPQIFTEETSLAARSYIIEHPFTPTQASPSPILSGIQSIPLLRGYIGTTAKNAAQTILVSDLGDPILAAWQYGLGKAVAFTSDATSRWALDWIRWNGFASFWAQTIRFSMGNPAKGAGLDVQVEPSGAMNADGKELLIVDGRTENGDYLNNYNLKARLIAPDGTAQSLTLPQVAPGRYEARFNPQQSGAYWIGISGQPDNQQGGNVDPQVSAISKTTGWVMPYPQEYRQLESNPQALLDVAAITGGHLASSNPADLFKHDIKTPQAARPAWPWLLILAALLLPFDIGVRRLVFSMADLRRTLANLIQVWNHRVKIMKVETLPRSARTSRVESLIQAKHRALRQQAASDREVIHSGTEASSESIESGKTIPEKHFQTSVINPDDRVESSKNSTAASLLAHKREKRKGGKSV